MLISHFQVTHEFHSVCIIVAHCMNLRQNVNMNYSYQTTKYEKEISIHSAVLSHEAGKKILPYQIFQQIGPKQLYSFFLPEIHEPPHEKTNVLHMRKQRRRSASR